MNRRHVLVSTGLTVAAAVSGCLGGNDDEEQDETPAPTSQTETETNTPSVNRESLSVDGRFYNAADATVNFELSVLEDDQVLISTTGEAQQEEVSRITGIGDPGRTLTYEVTVGERKHAETVTPGGEAESGELAGFIDIWYVGDDNVSISFTEAQETEEDTPTESGPDRPYVSEPSHEIDIPEQDSDQYNEEYLGAQMPTQPSIEFEELSVGHSVLWQDSLTDMSGEEFWTQIIRTESARDALFDMERIDETEREQLESVDFEESVLVIVETGYGSSSVDHRWARVEETQEGVHLHGYHTDPREKTDDVTTWFSVLEVERPATSGPQAVVSLTVSPDRRVTFDSTNGEVSPGE